MCDIGFLRQIYNPRTRFIYQIHPSPDWVRLTMHNRGCVFYKKMEVGKERFLRTMPLYPS